MPARAASLAAPLALLLAAFAFAAPVAAQTVVELVSNNGQTSTDAQADNFGKVYVTSFTTGSHSGGYKLTRVAVWLKKDGNQDRTGGAIGLRIVTDAAGTPGQAFGYGNIIDEPTTSWAGYGDNIRPNISKIGPAGINLDPNTKYWVQVNPESNQNTEDDHYFIGGTSSDNEDSGGLSGWSLGNDRLWRNRSEDTWNTNANALRLELRGHTTNRPGKPTGVTAGAATSTSLNVSWTAPAGTVTDYDLRYYAGSADPTNAADWVEEGEAGGPPDPGTSTSATVTGLRENTAYRVQVRAANADGEGAWSDSAGAETGAPPLLLSARVSSDGTELTLYYDQALDPNSAPAHAHFSANIAGTGRALPVDASNLQREDPVTVSGSTVTITLALDSNNAVTAGQKVAMGYNAANAAANPIKNLAGLKAPRVSALAAINDVGATGPTVTLQRIGSPPTHDTDTPADGTDDTYGVGAEIGVSLDFSEAVTVDTSRGAPRLKIGFGGGNHKWVVYEFGSGTTQLNFAYTVVSGDTSTAGVAVVANSLELTGGIIRSAATGLPASLAHTGLANNLSHKVDATLDAQPARFESATVDGNTLTVTFDKDLDTTSAPGGGAFRVHVTLPDGATGTWSGLGSTVIASATPRKVTTTLINSVWSSAVVTVSYTKPPPRTF